MAYVAYPFKHLKAGGRLAELSELGYTSRANALMFAGLCAVPWGTSSTWHRQMLINSSTGQRRCFVWSRNESSWAPPDEGLRDLHRDFCIHGVALVEGAAEAEQRFLSHKFPGHIWTDEEAAHCGGLRPRRLILGYRQLMSTLIFAP